MIVVPAATNGSHAAIGDGRSLRTLVIDRQPLFLAALANLLEESPLAAEVRTTARSDDGLDLVLAGGIDLVFCELRAEPLSGIAFLQGLAAQGCQVPVVLLGDEGDEAQLASALGTNAAGAFTKNAALDEFLVGVGAVVSGHRAIGSGLLGRLLDRSAPFATGDAGEVAGRLSPTERAILAMIAQAETIPAIAASRGISHKTVRNHLAKIYRKLDLHGRTEAMLWATRMGLTGI